MIDITYNVTQSQHKGALGYKPIVRGRILDSLFYRSIGHALRAAEKMAKAEAITLKRNGHETVVRMGEGLVKA